MKDKKIFGFLTEHKYRVICGMFLVAGLISFYNKNYAVFFLFGGAGYELINNIIIELNKFNKLRHKQRYKKINNRGQQ